MSRRIMGVKLVNDFRNYPIELYVGPCTFEKNPRLSYDVENDELVLRFKIKAPEPKEDLT